MKVAIVGAGIVGLWCAVRFAAAGARVTLLEAESEELSVWAPGASAAAAGMLAPLDAEQSDGDALAFQSLDLWRAAQPGAHWADGVRFAGGVVATQGADAARALAARARALGREVEALRPHAVRKRTGLGGEIEHAVFIADEAVADPFRVMTGLFLQARQYGVTMAYGRDVSEVAANRVLTFEGPSFEADAVVLAPGAWASQALLEAAPALAHVQPAKGHLIPVRTPDSFDANFRAPGFYLARRREDAVLGATLQPGQFDRRVDPVQTAQLWAALEKLLPGEVKPAGRAWTGIRPMSPDGWPMAGDGGKGVWIAAGHSRNGWLMAPLTAEIVTAYVFGHAIPAEWLALSPQRFS